MPYSVPRRGSRHSSRLDRQSSVESHDSLKQGAVNGIAIPSSPSRHLNALPVNVIIQRASTSPIKVQGDNVEIETTPMRKRRAMKLRPTTSEIPTPPTSFSEEGSKGKVKDMYQKEITPTPTPTPTPSTGKRYRDMTSAHSDAPSSASKRRAIQERKMDRSMYARSSRLEQSLYTRQMSPQTELSLLQDQSAPTGFYDEMSDDDDDEAYTRDRCILLPTKRTRDMSRSKLLSDTTRTPTKRQDDISSRGNGIVEAAEEDPTQAVIKETQMIEEIQEADDFLQQDQPFPHSEVQLQDDAPIMDTFQDDQRIPEAVDIVERDEARVEKFDRPAEQWRRPTTPMTPAFDFDAATPHKSPFTPRIAARMDLPMQSTPLALLKRKTPTSKRKSLPNPYQERKVRASLAALNSPHKAQRLPVEIEEERYRIRQNSEIPASSPLSRLRNEMTKSISPSPLRQPRERDLSVILAQELEESDEESDLEDFSHFTVEKTFMRDAPSPAISQANSRQRQSPTKRSREQSEEILEDDFIYETVVVENELPHSAFNLQQDKGHHSVEGHGEETIIAHESEDGYTDDDEAEEEESSNAEQQESAMYDSDENQDKDEEDEIWEADEEAAQASAKSPILFSDPPFSVSAPQRPTHYDDSVGSYDDQEVVKEGPDSIKKDNVMQRSYASSIEEDESDSESSRGNLMAEGEMEKEKRDTHSNAREDHLQHYPTKSSDGETDAEEEDDESDGDIEGKPSSVSEEKDETMEKEEFSEEGDLDLEGEDVYVLEKKADFVASASDEDSAESDEDQEMVSDDEQSEVSSEDEGQVRDDIETKRGVPDESRQRYDDVSDESDQDNFDEENKNEERLANNYEVSAHHQDFYEGSEEEENEAEEDETPVEAKASDKSPRRLRQSIIASHRDAIGTQDERYNDEESPYQPQSERSPTLGNVEVEAIDGQVESESGSDASSSRSSSPILEGVLYNPMKDMRIDQDEAQRRQQSMQANQNGQHEQSAQQSRATTPALSQLMHGAELQQVQSLAGNDSVLVHTPINAHLTPVKGGSASRRSNQSMMMEEEANSTVLDSLRDRMERLAATSTTVEITSLDHEVAARCAEILKEHHHYLQYGSVTLAIEEDEAGLSVYRASETNKMGFDEKKKYDAYSSPKMKLKDTKVGPTDRSATRSLDNLQNDHIILNNVSTPKTSAIPGHFPDLSMSNDSELTPSLLRIDLREVRNNSQESRGSASSADGQARSTRVSWRYLEGLVRKETKAIAAQLCAIDHIDTGNALWKATLQLDRGKLAEEFLVLRGDVSQHDDTQGAWSKQKISSRIMILVLKVQKEIVEQYPEIEDSEALTASNAVHREMPISYDTVNESTLAETTSRIPFQLVTQSTPTPVAKQYDVRNDRVDVSVVDESTMPVSISSVYPSLPSPISQISNTTTSIPPPPPPPSSSNQARHDQQSRQRQDASQSIATLASKSLNIVRANIKGSRDTPQNAPQQKQSNLAKASQVEEPTCPPPSTAPSGIGTLETNIKNHATNGYNQNTSSTLMANQSTSRAQHDRGASQFGRSGGSSYVALTALTGISPNSHDEARKMVAKMKKSREATGGTPRRNRLRAHDKSNVSVSHSHWDDARKYVK